MYSYQYFKKIRYLRLIILVFGTCLNSFTSRAYKIVEQCCLFFYTFCQLPYSFKHFFFYCIYFILLATINNLEKQPMFMLNDTIYVYRFQLKRQYNIRTFNVPNVLLKSFFIFVWENNIFRIPYMLTININNNYSQTLLSGEFQEKVFFLKL